MFIPKLSLGMLGVLLLLMLCPIVQEQTQAVELTPGQSQAENTTQARILVQSTISLALQNRVDVEVVPKSNGNFSAATAKMNVATNNSTGYGIYLGTVNQKSELTLSTDATSVIGALPTAVSESDFPNNTWGYRLVGTNLENSTEDLLYQAVPGETLKVRNVDVPNALAGQQDSYELSFGTKVDTTVRAGLYQNQVIVSVVANPRELQSFSELTFMQEMTPEICQSLKDLPAEQQTGQLIDQRDGKSYWVSYLADENCWMTQNLALDLSTKKPLTPSDSDVTEEWVPTTDSSQTVPTAQSSPAPNGTLSWKIENNSIVLATPQNMQSSDILAGQDITASLASLANFQQIDSSWVYENAKIGTWEDYVGLVAVDTTTKSYDSHYLVGNYYQYGAATAGSGNLISSGKASSSICPKGWKLPDASSSNNDFVNLTVAYGYPKASGAILIEYSGATPVYQAPLYFVRSGFITPKEGKLIYTGSDGGPWSSEKLATDNRAYNFYIYRNEFFTSTSSYQFDGYSIRCVAR